MKTILVTGASCGIGREIAIQLAQNGFNVAVTYNKNEKKAQQLKQEYNNISIYQCDVSSFEQVDNLYKNLQKDFDKIYAVVNNAGVSQYGLLQDIDCQVINNTIATNLCGVIYSCQKAAQSMVKQKEGKIINIASIWGVSGASCESVYSASKGGVITFTKALAQELAPCNITVNSVSPGVIQTDMMDNFSKQEMEELKQQTPLGKIGTVQDVAKTVLFLLSSSADFITGQNITVDGGFNL